MGWNTTIFIRWTLLLCGIPCSLQSRGLCLLWKEWYVIYYLYLLFFTVCCNGQMVSSIFMEFGEGGGGSLESSFKSGRSTTCLHPFTINGTAGLSIIPVILDTLKTWVFIRDFHITIFVNNIFLQLFWGVE